MSSPLDAEPSPLPPTPAGQLPVAPSAPALFDAAARRHPARAALIVGGIVITYATLHRQVDAAVAALLAAGLRPGDRLGVCLGREPRAIATAHAALRLGLVYVPLLPADPPARVAAIAASAGLATVVLADGADAIAAALPSGVAVLGAASLDTPAVPLRPRLPDVDERTAYLIHTSGSTGKPKGVAISHAALAHLIAALQATPGIGPGDVLLATAPFVFDMSIPDLFVAHAVGATVVLADEAEAVDGVALLGLMSRHGVTIMQSTPSRFRLMLGVGWPELPPGAVGPRLLCGGEALTPPLADALGRRGVLWNMYGPTETTVWSTARRVPRDHADCAIGGPLGDTILRVVGPNGAPVVAGELGELLIGGPGVATGYHGQPELTAERFVHDAAGLRFYRTGDLVRVRPDGLLDYAGRNDHQIKLRGIRIEPAEVEAALRTHPAVADALVLARGEDASAILVGYVVGHVDAPRPDAASVAATAAGMLPPAIRPAVVVLDAFPLTSNGKIDRAALPAPDAPLEAGAPPRTPTEILLASLWCDVLDRASVGREDDFLALGGDSLAATAVDAALAERFGRRVGVATLITVTRLDALAHHLDALADPARSDDAPATDAALVEIVRRNPDAPGTPVYALHNLLPFRPLADALAATCPFHAVALPRDRGLAAWRRGTVADLAEAYAAAVADAAGRDNRPVTLLGWCAAGPIALAAARLLEAAGRPVALVLLVDPEPAGAFAALQRRARHGAYRVLRLFRPLPPPAAASSSPALAASRDEGGFRWLERALAQHRIDAPAAPVVVAMPDSMRPLTAFVRRVAWRRALGTATTRFATVAGSHSTLFADGAADLAALLRSR